MPSFSGEWTLQLSTMSFRRRCALPARLCRKMICAAKLQAASYAVRMKMYAPLTPRRAAAEAEPSVVFEIRALPGEFQLTP